MATPGQVYLAADMVKTLALLGILKLQGDRQQDHEECMKITWQARPLLVEPAGWSLVDRQAPLTSAG